MTASAFLVASLGIIVTVRNTTVFVLPISASNTQKLLRFEVLQGAEGAAEVAEEADDKEEAKKPKLKQITQATPPANRITTVELFRPRGSELLALLLLVDERRLVHYELNLSAETLLFKTSRSVPRSATCMTVAHLKMVNVDTKYAVIVGQKTGEVLAVPFPDVARDLKTLLGHTTSMVTDVAVNHDSSLLLTADRDEKLRVSRFPSTTIIESYCLGHTACLTKVVCSAVTPELVVSTSMDNTLKLWNMMTGKLLATKMLLQSVEVSVEPLDEGADDTDNGRTAAKSLLNVSLAICSCTNIVAVLVNYQHVQFFEIVSDDGVHTLKEVVLPSQDKQLLFANEPCELLFTEDKILVVSYKEYPFLQLFSISEGENKKLLHVDFATGVLKDYRSAAATIKLAEDKVNALNMLEDGLQKKKARIGEWNKAPEEMSIS